MPLVRHCVDFQPQQVGTELLLSLLVGPLSSFRSGSKGSCSKRRLVVVVLLLWPCAAAAGTCDAAVPVSRMSNNSNDERKQTKGLLQGPLSHLLCCAMSSTMCWETATPAKPSRQPAINEEMFYKQITAVTMACPECFTDVPSTTLYKIKVVRNNFTVTINIFQDTYKLCSSEDRARCKLAPAGLNEVPIILAFPLQCR